MNSQITRSAKLIIVKFGRPFQNLACWAFNDAFDLECMADQSDAYVLVLAKARALDAMNDPKAGWMYDMAERVAHIPGH
jgi:hypothetical protein